MAQKDLIDLRTRTPEERRRISSLGGKARKKKKDEEKSMREWAKAIGKLQAKVVCPDGTALPGASLDADVIMQQYRKAHKGDTAAAAFLAKLLGEMCDKVAVKADGLMLQVGTQDEAQKLGDVINREQ